MIIGDAISYMTPTTKDTRRADWKALNFAGSVDWALDLQTFRQEDKDAQPTLPDTGEQGCIFGEDNTVNSGDLCELTCSYGFCPEPLCSCITQGPVVQLPPESNNDIIAWDELDVDLNRLCKFACKRGYCPGDICTTPVIDPDDDGIAMVGDDPNWLSPRDIRDQNSARCLIYKNPSYRDVSVAQCGHHCSAALQAGKEEGRTSNIGCLGSYPLNTNPPWMREQGIPGEFMLGECLCDNFLLNFLADTIIEALPIIAQVRTHTMCLYSMEILTVLDRLFYRYVCS